MRFIAVLCTCVTAFLLPLFGQDDLKVRHLLKRTAFFALSDGTVESADYWALNLGTIPVTVSMEFPGEGVVAVDGKSNFGLVSSGFVEGNGYGDRGIMQLRGEFAIKKSSETVPLSLDQIAYVYYGNSKVVLTSGATEELYIRIDGATTLYQPTGSSVKIFEKSKEFGDLKLKKEVPVVGFGFSREAAVSAYRAAVAMNE